MTAVPTLSALNYRIDGVHDPHLYAAAALLHAVREAVHAQVVHVAGDKPRSFFELHECGRESADARAGLWSPEPLRPRTTEELRWRLSPLWPTNVGPADSQTWETTLRCVCEQTKYAAGDEDRMLAHLREAATPEELAVPGVATALGLYARWRCVELLRRWRLGTAFGRAIKEADTQRLVLGDLFTSGTTDAAPSDESCECYCRARLTGLATSILPPAELPALDVYVHAVRRSRTLKRRRGCAREVSFAAHLALIPNKPKRRNPTPSRAKTGPTPEEREAQKREDTIARLDIMSRAFRRDWDHTAEGRATVGHRELKRFFAEDVPQLHDWRPGNDAWRAFLLREEIRTGVNRKLCVVRVNWSVTRVRGA